MVKYVFITGGVVSGLGKGITSSSLGLLLKSRGFKVTMQKFDPYLNFDAGTMNPIQHGECFVTDDGAETDLDLGHYERFIDENLNKNSNVTTGKIYHEVIEKERYGFYNGNTVQVIPHVTDQIISHFYTNDSDDLTFCLIEIGGTVGDIESEPYIEAIRQFRNRLPKEDTMSIHVVLVPYLHASGELKTKPAQQSVKLLQSRGVQPDIIILRSEHPIEPEIKDKISLFCNVKKDHVIENLNCKTIYEVPLLLEELNLCNIVLSDLSITARNPKLSKLKQAVKAIKNPKNHIKISLVGKYVKLHDAYLSVVEALVHGGIETSTKCDINWVDSGDVTKETVDDLLKDSNGIIVPGGFGNRGIEGMINACEYARKNNIPFLGLCLGMQVSIIEFCRNILNLKDANSQEFDPNSTNQVICILENQDENGKIGGTLRLGAYDAHLVENTLVKKLYNSDVISERHRHRYEVNPKYINQMEKHGLVISGYNLPSKLVEFVENKNCDFFIATQAHPELKSRISNPHPLFKGFVEASLKHKNAKN